MLSGSHPEYNGYKLEDGWLRGRLKTKKATGEGVGVGTDSLFMQIVSGPDKMTGMELQGK